jgi:hypothetical protein
LAYRSIMDTQILLRRYRQRSVRSRLARLFTQQASPLLPGRTRTSSAARRPMLFGTPCRPPRHRFAQEHGASCSQNKATRKRWWWFTHSICLHSGLQAPAARGMGTWAGAFRRALLGTTPQQRSSRAHTGRRVDDRAAFRHCTRAGAFYM